MQVSTAFTPPVTSKHLVGGSIPSGRADQEKHTIPDLLSERCATTRAARTPGNNLVTLRRRSATCRPASTVDTPR
jgi:hypothetical protein